VRELKASLAQSQPVAQNALWSELKTNRADRLPPDLWERVLEELGFNWQFSSEFIVVTKRALRDTRGGNPNDRTLPQGWILNDGRLSEAAVSIFALTPEERGQVEAVLQRGQAEFHRWALEHVKRVEPKGDVVANYVLAGDQAGWAGVSNNLVVAVGRERAELIWDISQDQLASEIGVSPGQRSMIIRRELVGSEQRLKADIWKPPRVVGSVYLPDVAFPAAFRPIFPNGWTDVAKREGFELPEQPQAK
jgi:hypothetical protein